MRGPLESDAEAGDPYACLAMAYFLQTGKELDMDEREAVRWYERAAALGCARAHWELTRIYTEGEIAPRDERAAAEHLKHAAMYGNADAMMFLGDEHMTGGLVQKDPKSALSWYSKAAGQGLPLAKFKVGYMLAHGIGADADPAEAETWFSSAAMTGDADMFLAIGMSYEYGANGVEQDTVEAARWYKYGVDMGHEKCIICWNSALAQLDGAPAEPLEDRIDRLTDTPAQREISAMEGALAQADELFGEGRMEEAYEAYSEAADLGSADAMFAKSMMTHQGLGTKRDDMSAVRQLSRAANAGSEDAQYYLARAYESGSLPADDSQIVKLYSDAAYNGFLAAYYSLSKYVDRPELYVRRTHTRRRCPSRRSSRPPRAATRTRRWPWATSSTGATASGRTGGRRPGGSASPPTRGTRRACATSRTSRPTATASAATSRWRCRCTRGPPSWGTPRRCTT